MGNNLKYFPEKVLTIKKIKYKYYLSPNLIKNNFKHGFFTKISPAVSPSFLSKNLNFNNRISVLKQIHSNIIVFGSNAQKKILVEADGMVCDKYNQILWIYTADCMPILFADKTKRFVAAIHCGRRGLENGIIKNLVKIFIDLGTSTDDLLVAIGPSISKKNYFIDKKTVKEFYNKGTFKKPFAPLRNNEILFNFANLFRSNNQGLIPLDLKKNALIQLLKENIPNKNIDISRLCTYDLSHEFYSWRRSRTFSRQWNFISS